MAGMLQRGTGRVNGEGGAITILQPCSPAMPTQSVADEATAMLEWTALLLQAATATPDALPARTSALPPPCPTQPSGDIVVCGRPETQESYRLRPMPERFVKDPQFRITLPGGSTITPHADQGRYGDLQAKVTLKVPF